jgi:hypothetical protein
MMPLDRRLTRFLPRPQHCVSRLSRSKPYDLAQYEMTGMVTVGWRLTFWRPARRGLSGKHSLSL